VTPSQKEQEVAKLRALIEGCQAAILVDYRGLNVGAMGQLRKAVRESGARVRVAKNTLLRRAIAGTPADIMADDVAGPTGVILCPDDVGGPAKAVLEFQKGHDRLAIRAAWADGRIYRGEDIATRSKLPGRQEMLGQLAGVLNAPIGGLARSMNGIIVRLARGLSEVAKKQEGAA
jgi:large subunit ribosomal protein L10